MLLILGIFYGQIFKKMLFKLNILFVYFFGENADHKMLVKLVITGEIINNIFIWCQHLSIYENISEMMTFILHQF